MNTPFNFKRAWAISTKEYYHILRDPFTLTMATVLPVVLVLIFGLAIEFNVKDIEITAHDSDKTFSSRRVIESFTSSDYFVLRPTRSSVIDSIKDLDAEKAKAVIIIPAEFEKNLYSSKAPHMQFILDGSDNSTAGVILGYLGGIQKTAARKVSDFRSREPIQIHSRYLFNPELSSPWFVVPGLAVVVTAILSILLTALTVAKEWETGSMELLLSTPVHPLEIIVGKLIPYIIIGMASILLVILAATTGFKIPFSGHFILYALGSLFFLISCLAQGMLISVLIRTQQLAMQLAMITGLLPSLLLSGFIFPIESMPEALQKLTSILPSKWFMLISRGIFLKGANFFEMKIPFLALASLSLALILLATKSFKRDLEP